jgi:hypothetical protein
VITGDESEHEKQHEPFQHCLSTGVTLRVTLMYRNRTLGLRAHMSIPLMVLKVCAPGARKPSSDKGMSPARNEPSNNKSAKPSTVFMAINSLGIPQ